MTKTPLTPAQTNTVIEVISDYEGMDDALLDALFDRATNQKSVTLSEGERAEVINALEATEHWDASHERLAAKLA